VKLHELVATGRRKRAVASVRLRIGSGEVQVNGKTFNDYFPVELSRKAIVAPLSLLGLEGRYDILCRASGGGVQGQAEAMRLAIARALVSEDADRRHQLKDPGFLRRDPRKRERKKYGLKGARKRFQFSKR